MRLSRHLRALAALALAAATLASAGPGAASAARSPRPDLYSFSAGRGSYSLEHGLVTLDLARVHPAIPLSSRVPGPLGRRVGAGALAAAAHRGSVLTVEIGGPTDEDSLSLRVRSLRSHGTKMVAVGTRLRPGARIRARHSFNSPDRQLPPRMRSLGLILDTAPGGPPLTVAGHRGGDVVVAFGHAPTPVAAASSAVKTFFSTPGQIDALLFGEMRRVDFTCQLATGYEAPLEVEVGGSYPSFLEPTGFHEQSLELPRSGERIPLATPRDVLETESGIPLYSAYGGAFSVSFEYPFPVGGALELKVVPPASPLPGQIPWVEAICRGTVEGNDDTEFGIPKTPAEREMEAELRLPNRGALSRIG